MRAVDWASLDYCYGEHTNVSELIETIAFGTQDEALEACGTLGNELEHQASIYSATYEAIPFLIEASAVAAAGARSRVLYLVAKILGSAIHWIEMGESAGEFDQDFWSIKFVKRTWLGSESFARFLHAEDDPLLRTVAAYVLGLLLTRGPTLAPADQPGRYTTAVTALLKRLRGNEPDEFVLSSVILALGRGAMHDLSLIEHLRKARTRPGIGEVTRVSVALAVMQVDDSQYADLEEVDLLIDTMCRSTETDGLFHVRGDKPRAMSPWIMGRLRFTLRKVLSAWSAGNPDRMERVLPALRGSGD